MGGFDPGFLSFEAPRLHARVLGALLLQVQAAPDGRDVRLRHLWAGRPVATVLVGPRLGPIASLLP